MDTIRSKSENFIRRPPIVGEQSGLKNHLRLETLQGQRSLIDESIKAL